MYEFIIDNSKLSGTVLFNGKLTIQNSTIIKNFLQESIKQVEHLHINHKNADEFDISYIQLLVSTFKTAVKNNKQFSVINNHPENFTALLKDSGCPEFNWMSEMENIEITGEHTNE
ncbi:MAG: hypothetical protein KJ571_12650 [Bacteroidetes bacterium]|nr:hypothetical protein [Bacteroidota bacterium]